MIHTAAVAVYSGLALARGTVFVAGGAFRAFCATCSKTRQGDGEIFIETFDSVDRGLETQKDGTTGAEPQRQKTTAFETVGHDGFRQPRNIGFE